MGDGFGAGAGGAMDKTDEQNSVEIQTMIEKEVEVFKNPIEIEKKAEKQMDLYNKLDKEKSNAADYPYPAENYMSEKKYEPTEKQKNEAKTVLGK